MVTPDATTLSLALSLDIWSKQPNPAATDRWKQTLTHIEGHRKGLKLQDGKFTWAPEACACVCGTGSHTQWDICKPRMYIHV